MWARKALQHYKWSSMGNSGEDSEGQIADWKADTKFYYKVQMGKGLSWESDYNPCE
jgi:hypothetical protein